MGIYQKFGLMLIINASGAVTRLGGAPMANETLRAFSEAAREIVPLEQVQTAAARLTWMRKAQRSWTRGFERS